MPGPEESRTPYPLLAKQTLYQMSYRPEFAQHPKCNAQRFVARCPLRDNWWALMGSNHRPQRYQHCALAS